MAASTRTPHKKGYKGLGLEGPLARWYAKTTGRDMAEFSRLAGSLSGRIPEGGRGARSRARTGLPGDRAGAARPSRDGAGHQPHVCRAGRGKRGSAGVTVTFQHGDAAAMPFEPNSFDLVVCRAAFKNFTEPVRALDEMHRVLKSGGKALIIDLRGDVCPREVDAHVDTMGLGRFDSLLTKFVFRTVLIKRAYRTAQFRSMAAASRFGSCEVSETAIGLDVWLTK